ncbi:hypothetical protein NPS01_37170 [Nocardioides psychrotolerans]|uniref:Glycosyltransferase A (GT-A) superfamily protein (DUF2064 family) n=1 Tax=Nocardioides psychrotolerans TaxID=1005945 RepID=A0A1I3QAP1_9ACTN|nr:DUF2064 domain-containing protein [Nocardioides psychrotolerans]GEP40054.1 hypothetical protein NPS01_37170 [Nocardioides psychrotolerans]SFJ30780.1 hypothetical protein SAMN05216561_12413 [Nocardioides psychrotolerans]
MKVLVLAKAPVAGRVKTRLGADVGLDRAADLAAAALLDTIAAGSAATDHRHLALDGDLAAAVRGDELREALAGWTITPQRGDGFAERLVNAHLDAGPGVVVQIGMDTPHASAADLRAAADALGGDDVVLGPALDGGWWVLVRRDVSAAAPLAEVEMSTPTTYDDTLAALRASGLRVVTTVALRDVDTVADADAVAALAPGTRFARAWVSAGATP